MSKTYNEILSGANTIKNETTKKANNASRVGTQFVDTIDYAKEVADKVEELDKEVGVAKIIPLDYSALPLLCGQPPILYGSGTPQKAVVPFGWKQYDAETDTGYNWNGDPSAIGQIYVNTSASTRLLWIAVPDNNGGLTWKNA